MSKKCSGLLRSTHMCLRHTHTHTVKIWPVFLSSAVLPYYIHCVCLPEVTILSMKSWQFCSSVLVSKALTLPGLELQWKAVGLNLQSNHLFYQRLPFSKAPYTKVAECTVNRPNNSIIIARVCWNYVWRKSNSNKISHEIVIRKPPTKDNWNTDDKKLLLGLPVKSCTSINLSQSKWILRQNSTQERNPQYQRSKVKISDVLLSLVLLKLVQQSSAF